ncbi:MAG: patatin family protein, partial [Pseudomonadota bacterium]
GEIGEQMASQGLPTSIQYLLGGLGSENQYSELASYLLFDSSYTTPLVKMGYEDTIKRKDEVLDFLCE